MSYRLIDIDLNQPCPDIQLNENEMGVGVIVRREGAPVGYVMQDFPSGHHVMPEEIEQMIAQELGDVILTHAIAAELLNTSNDGHIPSLTISICTKDHPDLLKRCLTSIFDAQESFRGALEVLVIDNASVDQATKDVALSFAGVNYAFEPKTGLDFARNLALNLAQGQFLAYLDDDVVIDPFWFRGFQRAWSEHPDLKAMTGLVLPYELKTEAQILFEKTGGFRRGYLQCRYGQTLEGNPLYPCGAGIFGTGANMMFHRDTLRDMGGFDLALDTGRPLPGGGDLDIYYRMIRANQVFIYEPTFAVHHQHRLEMAQLRRQYWSWGLGLMAYIMKSISQDPPMRLLFVRLIGWWFKYQLKRLKRSLLGKDIMPISFILIELWGGIQGALGSYGRSQRRIAKIQASTTEDVQIYQTLQLES